jgi:probable rRNA maturation factor
MSLRVSISNRQKQAAIDLDYVERTAEKLLAELVAHLSKERPRHLRAKMLKELARRGEFSLVLVSNRQIQKLNKEWMGKNKPTDVLSFPLALEPPPAELPWEVGEIVISLEKADEQAKAFGHSFERELAFLFVHGALHILGFDHIDKNDEKDMFARQKKILMSCGFER